MANLFKDAMALVALAAFSAMALTWIEAVAPLV
jgi:hypothetical protein